MSGKLPIDRVREAEHAPRLLEQNKQDLAQEKARLRKDATPPPDAPSQRGQPGGDTQAAREGERV